MPVDRNRCESDKADQREDEKGQKEGCHAGAEGKEARETEHGKAQWNKDRIPGPADPEGIGDVVAHAVHGMPDAGSGGKQAGHMVSPSALALRKPELAVKRHDKAAGLPFQPC